MIYIDPPYNTGKDFVYNDDFAMSREEMDEAMGTLDEEGKYTPDWAIVFRERISSTFTLSQRPRGRKASRNCMAWNSPR